jgi:hypothetical protein
MNLPQRQAFTNELAEARKLVRDGRLDDAFHHLERAHVLGQSDVRAHVVSHWMMLVLAVRSREFSAALGQVVRLIFGAIGSAVGVVPVGNTGGSNVSMFERMPIDPELAHIMQARVEEQPQSRR